MQTANADAESNCSSSGIIRLLCKLCWSREFFWAREFLSECKLLCCWLWWWWLRPLGGATIELDADPVEVVSEMEEPELKGGKDRSDGDGEDGATADCKHNERIWLISFHIKNQISKYGDMKLKAQFFCKLCTWRICRRLISGMMNLQHL